MIHTRVLFCVVLAAVIGCEQSSSEDPVLDGTTLSISGTVASAWEVGGDPIAGAVVQDLADPSNTSVSDATGQWLLHVASGRYVGAVVQPDNFLPYAHIIDTQYATSPTPEVTLLPFTVDALTDMYAGDYGYERQEGLATLVVMVADESGGDYTGATVTVSAEHEESLVEADNMDLTPGSVSGEPWAEVIFVNVATGLTTVNVVDTSGLDCAVDVLVDLAAESYVYLDTVCPSS